MNLGEVLSFLQKFKLDLYSYSIIPLSLDFVIIDLETNEIVGHLVLEYKDNRLNLSLFLKV